MKKKRIKVAGVFLAMPVLCGDTALILAQAGHSVIAGAFGLVALLSFIIGASKVQVIWR